MAEMRSFVYSVVFLLVFTALLLSVPVGLQGTGGIPETVIPVDPNIVSGYSDSETYNKTSYSGGTYEYNLGGYDWYVYYSGTTTSFYTTAKIKLGGVLWLGGLEATEITAPDGTPRGSHIDTNDIDDDSTDGSVRYTLIFSDSGNSAGSLVFYWNDTLYASSQTAWNNDALYILHGWGINDGATANIAALLLQLLTLQLPDCPILINVMIASAPWASIIYIFWYIIKESTPFL